MKRVQIITAFTVIVIPLAGCSRSDSTTVARDTTNKVTPNATSTIPKDQPAVSSNIALPSATVPTNLGGTGTAAPPATAEVYRQVSDEDEIRFYSRCQTWEFRGGNLHAEGVECGVIGSDGKDIRIELLSMTEDHGQIQTKDFGILKQEMKHEMHTPFGGTLVMPSQDNIQASGSGNTSKAFQLCATENQIKKLRILQLGQ